MCNVKGVARNDKPTENYRTSQQFPSSPWSILASFSLLCLGSLSLRRHQRCFQPEPDKLCMLSAQRQTTKLTTIAGERSGVFCS